MPVKLVGLGSYKQSGYDQSIVQEKLPGGYAKISSQGFTKIIEIGTDSDIQKGDSITTIEVDGGSLVVSAMPGSISPIERIYIDG